jgi:hypothetical protein
LRQALEHRSLLACHRPGVVHSAFHGCIILPFTTPGRLGSTQQSKHYADNYFRRVPQVLFATYAVQYFLRLMGTIIAVDPRSLRSGYEIVHRDCSNSHSVWVRSILVHVCNVPPAQHQGGHGRVGYGNGIIQNAAKNEQM